MRFVDDRFGVLWFGTYAWTTRDAGASWTQVMPSNTAPGVIVGGARSDDFAYLLVEGPCSESSPTQCPGQVVALSAASSHESKLAMTPGQEPRSITANGNEVYVLTTDGAGAGIHVFRSTDLGKTFADHPSKTNCLTGTLSVPQVSGTSVDGPAQPLWLECATGMQGGPLLSTDGGATFAGVRTPEGVANSSPLAAISESAAVIGTDTGVQTTTNRGETWTRFPQPAGAVVHELFVDGTNVFALVTPSSSTSSQLWYSGNGGQHWASL